MESAEALSAKQKSRRNVTIEITNLTGGFVLKHPKVHMENGNCHSPPQPTVRSMRTEVCNFTKTDVATTGAVGVLTYDIYEGKSAAAKLALMFSVPYDYTFYKNWVAVGIFPLSRETDEKLYKEMYEDKNQSGFVRQEAKGCGLTYESGKMDVKVTMSPLGRAIMKVELWDLHFHP
ncbi:DELTA-sagatoxin-Srs1a-like [Phyllopteryx taeniolatus]|uniref:DELTA-sagatoxin-Srs1a-like n=1 Tax=Phyllopteryx taeniolatus TaxID=161469 RepID=UPI002AD56E12|nr:DELTA-sagatoxin-Srs1a-like [Phyllopteryx taeniolatus]